MSSNSGHVCESVHGKRRRESIIRKHRKEYPDLNSSNCGLFTCGGCHSKFRTICCLHVHIDKHQEGGSYTFDHITKTAFPKYDSTCAFTQVENKYFELINDTFIRTEKISLTESIQTVHEHIETEHNEVGSIRKSKRIAKRNCNKDKVNSNKEKKLDIILEVKKEKHRKDVTSLVATPVYVNNLERVDQNDKNSSNIERFGTRRKKQKIHDQNKKQDGSAIGNSDDMNLEGVLNLPQEKSENERLNSEKDKIQMTSDTLENMNPKTDEIAASEALLAISKSAEGGENISGSRSIRSEMVDVENPDAEKDFNKMSKSKECEVGITDTELSNSNQDTNTFMQEEAYQKFVDTHKQDDETSPHSDPDMKQEKHRCPTCGKNGSRAMISYHKYLHKDQKELSCDVCGKQFQHPSCLKVHLRCHSDRMFPCDVCGSKFSRKKYLETHMLKHTGEKPFMCETCGKGYRDSNHLKRHIKHVHDKKRDFECDICQERFFRSDHLKCHRLRHFGPGYRCQYCKKMFKVKLDLERHTKTHTDEKKWFCIICGHGFRYPVPYYNHMLKKHEIIKNDAEVLRKNQIEGNNKVPQQLYIVEKTLKNRDTSLEPANINTGMEPANMNTGSEPANNSAGMEPANNYTDISEAIVRDEMDIASITLSTKPAIVPTVRKIYIRNRGANITDPETGTYKFNNKSKEVRVTSDPRILNSQHDSNIDFGQTDKGFEIVSIGESSDSKAVHVLSNLPQDTTSLQQGLTFALQNAFTEEVIDGTQGGGIVGYGDGDQLQGDQLVVMAEETVVGDINMISEMTGENTQAVIFLNENESHINDVSNKGTMI